VTVGAHIEGFKLDKRFTIAAQCVDVRRPCNAERAASPDTSNSRDKVVRTCGGYDGFRCGHNELAAASPGYPARLFGSALAAIGASQ
jgi:hypothetical protein